MTKTTTNATTPANGKARRVLRDARAASRLAFEAVHGVTTIVESVHQRIARVVPQSGLAPERRTRGITGFVYRTVRRTTAGVGQVVDASLAALERALPADDGLHGEVSASRDAAVAALNGVLGDHLARTGNLLAIPMELRRHGGEAPTGDIVVLVHGLCMNDAKWSRRGHDHGEMLRVALGWTPVYARYNTGRAISANGADLARALQDLIDNWPVPVRSLHIVGHSMGALVSRSAVHQAQAAGMPWVDKLKDMVFLGAPHHGAPLERAGNWLHTVLGVAPYVAPLARVSGLRSEGIRDLGFGDVHGGGGPLRHGHVDQRTPVPLPAGVRCYAVAGTLGGRWPTDGLVPIDSALGRHPQRRLALRIPRQHQFVATGVGHLDLLCSEAVGQRMLQWLRPESGTVADGR